MRHDGGGFEDWQGEAGLLLYYPFLKSLAQGEGEFQIRFGLVCLMDHYLVEDWLARVLDLAAMANTETYYARMGAAWLFTTQTLAPPFRQSFSVKASPQALTPLQLQGPNQGSQKFMSGT